MTLAFFAYIRYPIFHLDLASLSHTCPRIAPQFRKTRTTFRFKPEYETFLKASPVLHHVGVRRVSIPYSGTEGNIGNIGNAGPPCIF